MLGFKIAYSSPLDEILLQVLLALVRPLLFVCNYHHSASKPHITFDVVKMGEFGVKPQFWPLSDSILLRVAKALSAFGGVQSAMSYIIGHIGFSRYNRVELPAEASMFGGQELRGTEPPNEKKVPY